MLEVTVGGVRLLGGLVDDPRGLFIKENGFKGWESLPGGRREQISRPAAHGDFDLPVFRGSRVVTISGYALGSSMFELDRLRDRVTGIGADGSPVEVLVDTGGGLTGAVARVIEIDFIGSGKEQWPRCDFSIELVCPDPRKYGERRLFSGSSVSVHHYGNFPASPVVEVVGPRAAPYTVSGPGGRQVVVSQALTSGQTHRIDFASGGIYRNGVRQLGAITHFKPWTIDPGKKTTMAISSGSMTVQVTDTYM